MLAFASRRARTSSIRLVILMLTIGRGKVIQLRNKIATNHLPALPPIRGIYLSMLVIHPPRVSDLAPPTTFKV
jgi:hypothetical protein